MLRMLFLFFISTSSIFAFESTNIQILHSNSFNGDAFIYDTKDGQKTTITFEHFRTSPIGDFFMFVDIMDGERFDGQETSVYTELAPRFSLSKILENDYSYGIIQDIFIATQINMGDDYRAYLGGLGVDINVPNFHFVNLNFYYKDENIYTDATYQITSAYKSKALYNIHFEGFIDITKRDINTHNQLLYNLKNYINSKGKVFIGTEWIYYDYDYRGSKSKTSVFQVMLRHDF